MSEILARLHKEAAKVYPTIVLPEGHDPRIVAAAAGIAGKGLARVVLIGRKIAVTSHADDQRLDLSNVHIMDPVDSSHMDSMIEWVRHRKFAAGMDKTALREYLTEPVHFGGALVAIGEADGMVAGADTATSEVVRTAIRLLGVAEGSRLVSSIFLMIPPDGETPLTYSDCGVVPDPDAEQLASIAGDAHRFHQLLTGHAPRVAFLSFSTKGSAEHPRTQKVIEAARLFAAAYPDVPSDGELQADAALVPSVGRRKAPDSAVAGRANVLMYPDLDSGNIAYKLTERLAGYTALGPLLQGVAKPVHDLSRGCSVEDIIDVAAITAVQCGN